MAYAEFAVDVAPGGLGYRARRAFLRQRLRQLGEGAALGPGLLVIGPQNVSIGRDFSCMRSCTLAAGEDGLIEIGSRVALNTNVHINACIRGRIIIGNDVLLGPNVVIRSSDHVTDALDRPIARQGHIGREVVIEDDVWIGANVAILGGVRIGMGAVVAAGAVVARDVEPYMLVGGVPARPIKKRGTGVIANDGESVTTSGEC